MSAMFSGVLMLRPETTICFISDIWTNLLVTDGSLSSWMWIGLVPEKGVGTGLLRLDKILKSTLEAKFWCPWPNAEV